MIKEYIFNLWYQNLHSSQKGIIVKCENKAPNWYTSAADCKFKFMIKAIPAATPEQTPIQDQPPAQEESPTPDQTQTPDQPQTPDQTPTTNPPSSSPTALAVGSTAVSYIVHGLSFSIYVVPFLYVLLGLHN